MTDKEKMDRLVAENEGLGDLFAELDAEPVVPVGKTLLECLTAIVLQCRRETSRPGRNPLVSYLYYSTVPASLAQEAGKLGAALGISPRQAILFSLIVDMSEGDTLSRSDLADGLGGGYVQSLVYEKDLQQLADARVIIRTSRGGTEVRPEVMKAILENKPYKLPDYSNMSSFAILNRMSRLFRDVEHDKGDMEQTLRDLWEMVRLNPGTSFGQTVLDNDIAELDKEEQVLFFTLVFLYHERDQDSVQWWDLREFLDNDDLDNMELLYRNESLELQVQEILVYASRDGLVLKDYFMLADSVKEALLADCGGLHEAEPVSDLIRCGEIPEKELFYDTTTAESIDKLKRLLAPKQCQKVMASLKKSGLRMGFACLFYGSPGTGKTETVNQLARLTGRDILDVDVSKLKSMWVGESEKNLRALFKRYRRIVKDAKVAPILLFNEADAIFGQRRVGADRAVDKMENSLQNIILQEMEKLEGNLIATTNLTQNLDKAFERRFLYKVHFENPSPGIKARIWQSMIPDLSEKDAQELASSFNFTGGQIENVLRKRTIHLVLDGTTPSIDDLMAYCQEEAIVSEGTGIRIGYRS